MLPTTVFIFKVNGYIHSLHYTLDGALKSAENYMTKVYGAIGERNPHCYRWYCRDNNELNVVEHWINQV